MLEQHGQGERWHLTRGVLYRVRRGVGVGHSTILRVLHENRMHPYHSRKVHVLSERGYVPRVTFCERFLHENNVSPNFTSTVLFTEETRFTRDGMFNRRNGHSPLGACC
ncbi:hypothetical protein PR048_015543 [Dryococelus australis]|uniref:Transposase n=1 Tax=Dryococelus australis TaxID=614101 RepID=A0ABQ9HHH7_9NEOP|nr:hypothetical protein PR048_015543 [Dryococelus australis]